MNPYPEFPEPPSTRTSKRTERKGPSGRWVRFTSKIENLTVYRVEETLAKEGGEHGTPTIREALAAFPPPLETQHVDDHWLVRGGDTMVLIDTR